ncbi:hypothetical protein [Actinophytocola sp.]|jgi:hypothetical protein|uniref:hypothetical protein n=1 Tax=Actinophytocola sp. TaxID=1872138 RepID=UPI002EDB0D9B
MTEIGKLAAQRRQRKGTSPAAPDGFEWGTCQSVHEVGRSRARTIARVLLASGFVVTAYLAPGVVAPAIDSPVLVSSPADPNQPSIVADLAE